MRIVERGDQERIEAGRLTQRLQILLQQRIVVLGGEVLQIDGRLRQEDIEPALALRRLAAREPKMGSPLAVGRICAGSVELLATT